MKGGTITLKSFSNFAGLYDEAAVCPLTVGSVSKTSRVTFSGKIIFLPGNVSWIKNAKKSGCRFVKYGGFGKNGHHHQIRLEKLVWTAQVSARDLNPETNR